MQLWIPAGRARWVALGGTVAVVVIGWILLSGGGAGGEQDPALARIDKLERKKDVAGLSAATHDPNPAVAGRALLALSNLGGPEATSAANAAMKDERSEVRQDAARALRVVGNRGDVVNLTVALKSDSVPDVRAAAAAALGQLRAWDGVEALVAALDDPDRVVRSASITSLERILGLKFFSYKVDDPSDQRRLAMRKIRAQLPALRSAVIASYDRLDASEARQPVPR